MASSSSKSSSLDSSSSKSSSSASSSSVFSSSSPSSSSKESSSSSSSKVSSSSSSSSKSSSSQTSSSDFDYDDWTLVWSDEFNGPDIDRSAWTFERGYCRNDELQNYTDNPKNAYIEDGKLVIKTIKEQSYAYNKGWMDFSSASLKTRGKKFFTYGRFEIRARLPYGQAIWPAFWMCGENGEWPHNGEIDIMEFWGGPNSDNVIYSNVHYVRNGNLTSWGQKACWLPSGRYADDFHVIGLEWDEESLKFYVDGKIHNIFPLDTQNLRNIFSKPFFLWINTAVAPDKWNWGDAYLNTYPQTYEIDYVRVYQKS